MADSLLAWFRRNWLYLFVQLVVVPVVLAGGLILALWVAYR